MKIHILADLDSFLDSRIGTIAKLNEQAAVEALNNGYWERETDEMGLLTKLITTEQYRDAYAKRDWKTLAYSRPTKMCFELHDMVTQFEKEFVANSESVTELSVTVNIYPYKLTPEEQEDIAVMVTARCGTITKVKTVDIPYLRLTTEYIASQGWTILVMYNYAHWIEVAFPKDKAATGMPDTSLIFPMILKTTKDLTEERMFKLPDGREVEPFSLMQETFINTMKCIPMLVEDFSVVDLRRIKPKKKTA